MTVLSVDSMRKLEQAAVEGGLSFLRLMENAGSAAARIIRSTYAMDGRRVTVLCGNGNNGGDGFVIARKLMDEGALVTVVLMNGAPTTPQSKETLARLAGTGVALCHLETEPFLAAEAVRAAGMIVDAVFGIGFHGALPDYMRHLFRLVRESAAPVVAVDIPSGLAADTGAADADAVRATLTVTFSALKPALIASAAAPYYGQVEVAAIGIDKELIDRFSHGQMPITPDMVQAQFAPRAADSHKGSYGHLLCVAGSDGMAGAARLCAEAALRCGVGLLTAALPRCIYPIVSTALPEALFLPLDGADALAQLAVRTRAKKASAVVLGCGMGQAPAVQELIWDVLSHGDTPLVLDADGINVVSLHIDRLKTIQRPMVLTPHPAEMARLTHTTVEYVQAHRASVARAFAEEHGVTLVLKGHETVVASPHRALLLNHTGNPGMATGGSGDVLAGMIGALLAQGFDTWAAAMCAVYLHGAAGDRAAARLSQHATLPRDIINELGGLFLDLEKRVLSHDPSAKTAPLTPPEHPLSTTPAVADTAAAPVSPFSGM